MRIIGPLGCAVLALATAMPARADDAAPPENPTPMTEAAYRTAAEQWNETWGERPSLSVRDEASCITAWQTGDRVGTLVRAATPPAPFEGYHAALLACIEASLAVSDECLLKPQGGPKWMPYFLVARKKCPEIARLVTVEKLALPRTW